MKIKINGKDIAPLPKLPCLYKNKEDGFIVLFIEESAGINLVTGEISHEWVDCTDGDVWEIFEGTISLTND